MDVVTGWYSLYIFILQIMFKNKDEEEEDDPTPSQNRLYKEQQGYYSQQDYYRQTILLFVYEPEPVIQGAAGILLTAGLLQANYPSFCLQFCALHVLIVHTLKSRVSEDTWRSLG
jgi:hypothetical protein